MQTTPVSLLHRLQQIEAIDHHDPRLAHVHFDWIDASERTQATVRLLSEQLRRFLDQRSLTGYALAINEEVLGYSYCVHDEHKGLIGDLYIRRQSRTAEHEIRLLGAVLDEMIGTPHLARIESQLMMVENLPLGAMPGAHGANGCALSA